MLPGRSDKVPFIYFPLRLHLLQFRSFLRPSHRHTSDQRFSSDWLFYTWRFGKFSASGCVSCGFFPPLLHRCRWPLQSRPSIRFSPYECVTPYQQIQLQRMAEVESDATVLRPSGPSRRICHTSASSSPLPSPWRQVLAIIALAFSDTNQSKGGDFGVQNERESEPH